MDHEKEFYESCEGKEAFLDHKKIGFKKPPKFAFFSKGLVHGFFQKLDIF